MSNLQFPFGPVSAQQVYDTLLAGRYHWLPLRENRKTAVICTWIDFSASPRGAAMPNCEWRIRISRDDYRRLIAAAAVRGLDA